MNIGIFISGDAQYWRPLADQTFNYLERHLVQLGCKISLINPEFINQQFYHLLNIDCVFIAQHDIMATKGYTQALLDIENIPYVGSGVETVNNVYNKSRFKKILGYENLPAALSTPLHRGPLTPTTVQDIITAPQDTKITTETQQLWYGDGIIKGNDARDCMEKIEECFRFCHTALIEPYHSGTEHFACIVVNRQPLAIVKRSSHTGISPYTYTSKYSLSQTDRLHIEGLARKVSFVLELEGLVQIDFQLTPHTGIVIENVLTHPPIYPEGSFVTALEKADTTPGEVLDCLISKAECYCVF